MTVRTWRKRFLVTASLALASALVVVACTPNHDRASSPASNASPLPSSPLQLHIGAARFRLDAPVEREVAVSDGKTIYLAGGLDAGGASASGVFSMNPLTGRLTFLGSLPQPVHDAAGALFGDHVVLFGGGSSESSPAVQSFDLASKTGGVIGHLPMPLSDLSAATLGGRTYLVGGWDGRTTNRAIFATTDGTHFDVVGRLPTGLRYAAVASDGTRLIVAGGQDQRGQPVSSVSAFDPRTGNVTDAATLPAPVSHAQAFLLGGSVYVVGGRDRFGNATGEVWRIDTGTGTVTQMPPLAKPVADAGVTETSDQAWLVGGWRGSTLSQVILASMQRAAAAPTDPPMALGGPPRNAGISDPARVRPFAGKLLVADRGNNRLLVLTPEGRVIWRYPAPSLPPPPAPFYFPDDAFWVHGGHAILVNEEENDVLAEIAYPSGRTLWTYGVPRTPGSITGYLHQPDDVYPYPGGGMVVADALNCRILFFDPRGRPSRQIGQTGNCTAGMPSTVGYPNGDTPLPNGHLLVSELHGSAISEVTATGHPLWTVHIPYLSLPSDPQRLADGTYLAAGYSYPGVVVRFTSSGKVLWTYRPTSGPGVLDHPSLAAPLPNGLVAVTDDYNHRVVLIDPKNDRIVWQYGTTNVPGASQGYLNTPDGLDLLLPGERIPLHVDFPQPEPRRGRP